jgi:para-aminobenzoate synthetase/4-amino-4-deoxychorismate lyase
MQLIHQLERRSRGIYTGGIGYFSPAGEAVFNVAIRTLALRGGQGRMGVGSGIVWDSVPQQEYEECLLKSEFLNRRDEEFSLIESLRWDRGYPLLDAHLERLEQSADYFGFPFDGEEVRGELESYGRGLDARTACKVRVRFDPTGDLHIESAPLEPWAGRGRVLLSKRATCSQDRFLFHKTTRRELYDSELARAQQQGFDDVIFVNERSEVTEGSISNVFAEIGGRLCTPPVKCGLLPGVYRGYLLRTDPRAEERVLRLEDLRRADALYISNAVRGLRKVHLVTE